MAAELFHTATEFISSALTIERGSVADITSVGVYFSVDPTVVPAVGDFTVVVLANGTTDPPDPLAIPGQIDVVARIGARVGADLALATPGDYQGFVLIVTAQEDVIRKTDVLTIL